MGKLVDGVWQDVWYDTKGSGGKFVRKESVFREFVTADGSSGFQAEAGRYHLYISYACPWACRTLIFRKLKKLEEVISLSVVDQHMGEKGWFFSENPGATLDTVNNKHHLYEIYTLADSKYTGRVTVPVLWDKKTNTIVNNESSEIIRMFNSEFNNFTGVKTDYYPDALRKKIDNINQKIYRHVNNGVYKCGFASTQNAYEIAFNKLFETLDELEMLLSEQRYLAGEQITEADWRLFTTLVRFDAVYVGHFKCNKKRIEDYPNLQNYLRELYQIPGIAETVKLDHIKNHYYGSHKQLNPSGIVPKGPDLTFNTPHNRNELKDL